VYHTASDVLGVLIAAASGQPLETFLHERIFERLGMKDTGFSVPATRVDRLATSYQVDPNTGVLELYDEAKGGEWSRPPAFFPSAGGGLVSTIDDYGAFGQMMLNKGSTAARASCPGLGRDHDDGPADARAEGGVRSRRRLLREPRLGVRRVRRHKARQRRGAGRSIGWMAAWARRGVRNPTEDMIGILMTQPRLDVAHFLRCLSGLLDLALPGDRRLSGAGAPRHCRSGHRSFDV